jgi:molecular chaperone DnaK
VSDIVGIDLGTTFSALAKLNAIGKPEIVPNADGERLTPSAIFFDEENPDMIRVGIEAINSRHLDSKRSVRWIKRHMTETDYTRTIDKHKWTPVELSSLILKKLKKDCCSDDASGAGVVISVPAHFDEAGRKATMQAGLLAGLDVIGIVNEPVAAALYYATTCSVSGKVLVYDLGGGTFDVTIMDVKDLQMDIICSQGDHALGGIDFDKAVIEMIEKKYKASKKTGLITSDEEKAKYEDEAEDIKKTLSRRKTAKKMIYGSAGSLRLEITRKMFEEAISPSIERTNMLLELALKEASLKPDDIDKVLLVGGSSRLPLVKQQLEKMFGFAPEITVNVDECVALGAAIHAGLTMLRIRPDEVGTGIVSGLRDIELTDVCNHSYGTLCAPIDELTGKRIMENRIILKKNTPLPCEETQTFYTTKEGQNQLQVAITQGEDIDPEYVNNIALGKLELPGDRPKNCPIKVTYSYDLNQRMHCMFEDTQSGKSIEVDLEQVDNGPDSEKVREQTEEMAQFQIE